MRPTSFDQSNARLLGGPAARYGTDEDVTDLEVYRGGGEIISAWRPSFAERARIALGGKVWLRVASATTSPPVEVAGRCPFPFDPQWYNLSLRPFGLRLFTAFNRRIKGGEHAWGLSLLQFGQRHLFYLGHDAVSLLWMGKSK